MASEAMAGVRVESEIENTCCYVGVVVVMSVRRMVSRGARGEFSHLDEAWIHPIPTVYF